MRMSKTIPVTDEMAFSNMGRKFSTSLLWQGCLPGSARPAQLCVKSGPIAQQAVAGWLLTCPNTLATPYQWTIQGLTCEPPFTYGFGQSETIGDGLELKVEF